MERTIKKSKKSTFLFSKRTNREKIFYGVIFTVFAVYTLSLVYPFFWMIMTSFKDGILFEIDTATGQTLSLPSKWVFSNYADAFTKMRYKNTSFLVMGFNSLWFIAFSLLSPILANMTVGYCCSRYRNRFTKTVFIIAIFSMTVPIVGASATHYRLSLSLGIHNNPMYPIINGLSGYGFAFLVMYAFFSNVSKHYHEAVFMDGGGHFTAFFKVMLPQAIPALSTLCIINSVVYWNDYTTPLLYLPSFPTIASGLHLLQYTLSRGSQPVYFSALVISVIPTLLLFAIFSDVVMKNFTVGGLKG